MSQQNTTPAEDQPAPAAPPVEFDVFQVVFLVSTGMQYASEEEAERTQAAHLGNLADLGRRGKMFIAGPVDQAPGGLRGICVMNTETLEEARELMEKDPAVKIGRLKVDVLTWYVPKGVMNFETGFDLPSGG